MLLSLSWRSLWRHRRRTLLTASSIGLSLALTVFFVALSDGFYGNLVQGVVRLEAGNLSVERPDYHDAPEAGLVVDGVPALRARLAAIPGVVGTKALVLADGVASGSSGGAAVRIVGVEPAVERAISPIARKLVAGAYLGAAGGRDVIVGAALARRLSLKVGARLVLTTGAASGDLAEQLFRVGGIFRTGSEELDGHLVQVPIDAARALLGLRPEQATRVGVLLADGHPEAAARAAVAAVAGAGLAVRTWQEVLPDLAAFIRVDTASNYGLDTMLLLLAGFTIFNTLLMSVLERRREFGVMMALGTTPRRVQAQVLVESALLAILACALGLLVGGGAAVLGGWLGIDVRSFASSGLDVGGFAIDPILRPHLSAALALGLTTTVLVAVVLMALVPIRSIPRIQPTEAMR
ncbi:MAG TPA: FtsX-like permease family protein [Anaeromyxobacteraceae bacterium]|nr:FtsX-like permease family protein [Anaeromyxobacteraceae bacterium]